MSIAKSKFKLLLFDGRNDDNNYKIIENGLYDSKEEANKVLDKLEKDPKLFYKIEEITMYTSLNKFKKINKKNNFVTDLPIEK